MVANWGIDVWQPCRRLLLRERKALGGGASATAGEAPRTLTFSLREDGEKTRLSLGHGEFSVESGPEFIALITRGWEFELCSLRHYLERHFGVRRKAAWLRRRARRPVAEIWHGIMNALAIDRDGTPPLPQPGERLAMRAPAGEILTGTVEICDPPHQLVSTVAEYQDALFRIKLAEQPDGWVEIEIWLSTWGLEPEALPGFARAWAHRLAPLMVTWGMTPSATGCECRDDLAVATHRTIQRADPVGLHCAR
jgi:hypothetical protein